jgi:hypothetical protein
MSGKQGSLADTVRAHQCPLCQGTGGITLSQCDALTVGRAIGSLTEFDIEALGTALSQIIGEQIAAVLSEYHVALVREEP